MTINVPIHGGPAHPVSVSTDNKAIGRLALRAYGFTSEADAIAEGYRSEAGPAMSVMQVTQAQLDSGQFVLDGDPKAIPLYAAPAGMKVEGGYSQPIFLVGGSIINDFINPDKTPVRYGGIDQADFAANATLSGTATGRTLISGVITERMRQDGFVRKVVLQVQNNSASFKIKVFRPNGANYDFVGESESITFANTGKVTVTLAQPIPCKCGDVVGVYLSDVAAQLGCVSRAGANSIRYLDSDVTGTNINFTNAVSDFSMCLDFYGYPPYLVVTGDSIEEGHNTLNNWHSFYDNGPAGTITSEIAHQVRSLIGSLFEYQNHATSGQGIDWVNSTGIVSSIATRPVAYLIHAGVNNVSNGQNWAYVEANLDQIKAQIPVSAKLYIDEILPWTNANDTQAATIRAWNTNLVTWCAANNATLILCHDAMGQVRVSTGQIDDLKTIYDQDGVHLTQSGVDAMASIRRLAIS